MSDHVDYRVWADPKDATIQALKVEVERLLAERSSAWAEGYAEGVQATRDAVYKALEVKDG
jgi:hypothetical protein